ncbi:hypothetical protein P0309_003899 [Citrobacter freundii]|nr:hypothetical protein [Citrobacter freundii]
MTNTPEQGAAFPIEGYSNGISIRDYFAAKAMQAMIAAHEPQGAIPGWAYEMADEMLRAREAS